MSNAGKHSSAQKAPLLLRMIRNIGF